jgi:flavin-dependent dehydrogenase
VVHECDVVVAGGGPGGIGAAVSAARNGADTVLIDRCGCLGGMATGGLVTILPCFPILTELGKSLGKDSIEYSFD